MATRTRDPKLDEPREGEPEAPAHEGDVLGLGDADPDVDIPQHSKPGGGRPKGLDVRDHATGLGDLDRTPGATGIDMGAGGEGTGISSTEPRRPRSANLDD